MKTGIKTISSPQICCCSTLRNCQCSTVSFTFQFYSVQSDAKTFTV